MGMGNDHENYILMVLLIFYAHIGAYIVVVSD